MRVNTLNDVVRAFKKILRDLPEDDSLARNYYEIIVDFLLLEHKYAEQVDACGKNILYYFAHHLPVRGREYFEWLYNVHNPVRFSVETFDSVAEIREELQARRK